MQTLLSNRVALDTTDADDNTPLHLACRQAMLKTAHFYFIYTYSLFATRYYRVLKADKTS